MLAYFFYTINVSSGQAKQESSACPVSLEASMTLGAERQTALSDCSWTYILDNPLLFDAILMTVDQQAHQAVLDSAFTTL